MAHLGGAEEGAYGLGEQVKNLMNMLASDKAALRSANITLQGTDIQVGSNTNAVSVFNGY